MFGRSSWQVLVKFGTLADKSSSPAVRFKYPAWITTFRSLSKKVAITGSSSSLV